LSKPYDALLIVGFGGPEGPDDVIPFLENVLRGKNVPRERMLEVTKHYQLFGGVSPINEQARQLIEALKPELESHDINLPLYWGNRNWQPMLADTLQEMANNGVQRALALVLAGYSSYSSCRQYLEDIERTCEPLGEQAPQVEKIRVFYNHPDFIAAVTDKIQQAINQIEPSRQAETHIAFTAHSIPHSMSDTSDYVKQLEEACRLVSEAFGIPSNQWQLVYQSRSGRPQDPWLEPDILDHLNSLHNNGVTDVIVAPIGFLSDHLEVLYDLDTEAQQTCSILGLNMVRAATVGTHPRYVQMWRKLIQERLNPACEKQAVGQFAPNHDTCPAACCPRPTRPA